MKNQTAEANEPVARLLRRSKERLELAVQGSNLSIWEIDMPDGRIENSRQTYTNMWESLGYSSLEAPTDFASAFALGVHPDDQERMGRAIREFLASDRREVACRRSHQSSGSSYNRHAPFIPL